MKYDFKVGDRVKYVDDEHYTLPLKKGDMAFVTLTSEEIINFKWDKEDINKAALRHFGKSLGDWKNTDKIRFVKVPTFDSSKPFTLRSGKAITVVLTDDRDRPYSAHVNGILLTYDEWGYFYPGHENPVDLVQNV